MEKFLIYFIAMYVWMLSPGPSMALISRNSAKFGVKTAAFTIFGTVTSVAIYSTIAILGVGALIGLYPNAFKAFKIIGSCYIVYVGIKIFLSSLKKNENLDMVVNRKPSKIKLYLSGLTTDLANPLTVVGITSVILGFVQMSDPISHKIGFFTITVIDAFLYCFTYAFLFGNPVSRRFILPRMSIFEKISGILIMLIGIIFLANTLYN
jgi:threonine/homoserine/homoserine lactone efflux protein